MTVTIKYQSQFSNDTLTSYTQQWATTHGDIKNTDAPGFAKDVGAITGGAPGDWLNGNQYAIGSSHGADTGMIITGELHYSFMFQHTFYGKMESLELGENLSDNPNGIGKQLDQVQLKICGLDITGEYNPELTKEQNHQGEMHKATYGLMRGNAEPLLEILAAKGIDVNTPLKDMAIASQFDTTSEMMADAPIIDTIGSYDGAEILMAA